jgi:hypothetical protein
MLMIDFEYRISFLLKGKFTKKINKILVQELICYL